MPTAPGTPPAPGPVGEPSPLEIMQLLYDLIDVYFGGDVDKQCLVLWLALYHHGMKNGCAHAYIEAMEEDGFLRFDYHADGKHCKRILCVRRPGDPVAALYPDGRQRFLPPTTFAAMTRLHRLRLATWPRVPAALQQVGGRGRAAG